MFASMGRVNQLGDYLKQIERKEEKFHNSLEEIIGSIENNPDLLNASINGKNIHNNLLNYSEKLNKTNQFYDEEVEDKFNPYKAIPKIISNKFKEEIGNKEDFCNIFQKWNLYTCNNNEFWSNLYETYNQTKELTKNKNIYMYEILDLSKSFDSLIKLVQPNILNYDYLPKKDLEEFGKICKDYLSSQPLYFFLFRKNRIKEENLRTEKGKIGKILLEKLDNLGQNYRKEFLQGEKIK